MSSWNEKGASSLDSFQWKLLGRSSETTDEMFGVITTVSADRVWRCKEPSQVSRTANIKEEKPIILPQCFSPACQSVTATSLCITHSCPSKLFVRGDYFYLQPKETLTSGVDCQLLQLPLWGSSTVVLWHLHRFVDEACKNQPLSVLQQLHPCCLEQNMTEPGYRGQIWEKK